MDQSRTGAWAGIVGPVLFVTTFLLEGWLRPGYDPLADYVSALSLGPRGWTQIANFVVVGACLLLFSRAVTLAFPSGRASRVGPVLLAIVALGYLLSGPFAMDPAGTAPTAMSPHGLTHGILGGIVFTLMPVVCLVFLRRFAVDPIWRSLYLPTLIATLVIGAAVIVLSLTTKVPALIETYRPWAGLIQRSAIMPFMAWIVVFAVGLLLRLAPTPA